MAPEKVFQRHKYSTFPLLYSHHPHLHNNQSHPLNNSTQQHHFIFLAPPTKHHQNVHFILNNHPALSGSTRYDLSPSSSADTECSYMLDTDRCQRVGLQQQLSWECFLLSFLVSNCSVGGLRRGLTFCLWEQYQHGGGGIYSLCVFLVKGGIWLGRWI